MIGFYLLCGICLLILGLVLFFICTIGDLYDLYSLISVFWIIAVVVLFMLFMFGFFYVTGGGFRGIL